MRKILILTFFLSIVAFVCFVNFEPTVGVAAQQAATSSVNLSVNSAISITGCTGNSNMSPSLDLTYNSAVGTSTGGSCNIKTTKENGYHIDIKSTSSPALQTTGGTYTFDDYSTTTQTTWTTNATQKKLGFRVFGDNFAAPYSTNWGTDTNCGSGGTLDYPTVTSAKYLGLMTTATTTVNFTSATSGSGNNFTICVAAAKGSGATVNSGNHQASLVMTAIEN